MISKAVLLFVRYLASGPGGGVVNGKALNHLQPQHVDGTDFTSFLRVGIQYCSRTAAMVRPTPPCNVSTWILCTRFLVKRANTGRYTGYHPWILLWHSKTPSTFVTRLSWDLVCSKWCFCRSSPWTLVTHQFFDSWISSLVRGPCVLWEVKRLIQAWMLRTCFDTTSCFVGVLLVLGSCTAMVS